MIKVYFTSQVPDTMPWKFTPTQREVKVCERERSRSVCRVRRTDTLCSESMMFNKNYLFHSSPFSLNLHHFDATLLQLVPGETALAFYTAKNMSDKAITGVATYNVTPVKAGE